jgi:hypothetical protein
VARASLPAFVGPRRASTRLPLVLAVLALGPVGCSDSQPSSDTTSTAVATRTPDRIQITTPPAIGTVALDHDGGRSTLLVQGTAPPLLRLLVRADCSPDPCLARTTTRVDGTWSARVRVSLESPERRLAVSADPADRSSPVAGYAVVVLLTPEEARRTHRRPAARSDSTSTQQARPAVPPARPGRTDPAAPRPDPSPQPTTPPTSDRPAPATVHAIGDSLIEGIAPHLPALLPGSRFSSDFKRGRRLAQGLDILRRLPSGATVAVSLFTNDHPRRVGELEAGVREALTHLGPRGCIAWATFVRPPVDGVSYRAANDRLATLTRDPTLAGRLQIVPWARAVDETPSLVGSDGIHSTPGGYQALARLYAAALARCP